MLCDIKAEVHRLATTVFELRQITDAASDNAGAWAKKIVEALEALEKTVAIQHTGSRVAFAAAIEKLAKDLRPADGPLFPAPPPTFTATCGPEPKTAVGASPTPKMITTTVMEY